MRQRLLLIIYLLSYCCLAAAHRVLVVGSLNLDTFLTVDRLPTEGENLVALDDDEEATNVPGGKGCTQAIAAARLAHDDDVCFVGQLGYDGKVLQDALSRAGVNLEYCVRHTHLPSGRGYVFRTRSGQVSAVVSGGSNQRGWGEWLDAWKHRQAGERVEDLLRGQIDAMLRDCGCVLLQREVPEYVNRLVASCARSRGVLVLQDVGGKDRPMDADHLACCDYLIPNESELARLVESFGGTVPSEQVSDDAVTTMARFLQWQSPRPLHILVTRGSLGSLLLTAQGEVIRQAPCHILDVLDETGAGDCFRAAFAVALMEEQPVTDCLAFASAAGACSVEAHGAVPSAPSRRDVETKLQHSHSQDQVLSVPRGEGFSAPSRGGEQEEGFPFLIGSRLNSMQDRPELWPHPLDDPREFVKRQATIPGLSCVDFNYPQHFQSWDVHEAKQALDKAGLAAGAVCLRYPSQFARGAMNHPDPDLRRDAIDMTKQAAEIAQVLGTHEVVVWSAFDGYDYPFQVDYDAKWNELVAAFQELCDEFPHVRISLEYKPTDENTRFFTVPTTGAAMLLVNEVDRPNFGLTLDVGHMLMAGENPGQSIAMVGRAGKLFGIQLNDGYTRLAAEDGLMFGSIHPAMALEVCYHLRRVRFDGHLYFDTFPQRSDPVKEAEYNIRRVKALWKAACTLDESKLQAIWADHDAIGALNLIDDVLRTI